MKIITTLVVSGLLAATLTASPDAAAEVFAYIPNTAGGTMYVTDASCTHDSVRGFKVHSSTKADGVLDLHGCLTNMDRTNVVIYWDAGFGPGEDSFVVVIDKSHVTRNQDHWSYAPTTPPPPTTTYYQPEVK